MSDASRVFVLKNQLRVESFEESATATAGVLRLACLHTNSVIGSSVHNLYRLFKNYVHCAVSFRPFNSIFYGKYYSFSFSVQFDRRFEKMDFGECCITVIARDRA